MLYFLLLLWELAPHEAGGVYCAFAALFIFTVSAMCSAQALTVAAAIAITTILPNKPISLNALAMVELRKLVEKVFLKRLRLLRVSDFGIWTAGVGGGQNELLNAAEYNRSDDDFAESFHNEFLLI
jgi:hypothetical protein